MSDKKEITFDELLEINRQVFLDSRNPKKPVEEETQESNTKAPVKNKDEQKSPESDTRDEQNKSEKDETDQKETKTVNTTNSKSGEKKSTTRTRKPVNGKQE